MNPADMNNPDEIIQQQGARSLEGALFPYPVGSTWASLMGMLFSSGVHAVVLTGNLRGPIGEHTGGILLPRPDVEFIESRDAVAIRSADIVKDLTQQSGRHIGVGISGFGNDDILYTNQLQSSHLGLIDQSFGVLGVNLTVADQLAIDKVDAHRSLLRAADTAKE